MRLTGASSELSFAMRNFVGPLKMGFPLLLQDNEF